MTMVGALKPSFSGAISALTGAGSGVLTFLVTPSSANLRSALTDETGSGLAVFNDTPTLIAPLLGTPTSGTLTNCTLPAAQLTGTTLPAAIVTSSLTSVGTLSTLTISGGLALTGTAGAGFFTLANQGSPPSAPASGNVRFYGGSSGQLQKKNASNTVTTFGELEAAGQTWTSSNIYSFAGAASTSAIRVTGVPFAGTGTTSFPLLYIQDASATASTTLNTAGTYLGVNGDGTQDLANFLKDGTTQFKVSSGGAITAATSFTVTGGTAVTAGGVTFINTGIAGWNGRGQIGSSASGAMELYGNSSFNTGARLGFGGATNSFPAINPDAVNGFTFQSAAGTSTWNDPSTANSGTVANRYLVGIAAPTLTSTGTSVTNTVASTFYIGAAPTDSTNTTSTTKWALNVAAGGTNLGGLIKVGGGTNIANIRHGVSNAMTAGSVSVTDTGATANTRYFFSTHTIGTITLPASYYASARSAGASFTLTSSQITDTSTVDWVAIEP